MPTYEYLCDACEHQFDEFQSITAKPLRKCPGCGKAKLKRLIGTGAGIIFKGSGFYETDYRSESYKQAAKAESDAGKPKADAKADSNKNESGKSDSTAATAPAKKAEAKPTAKPEKKAAATK